MKNAFDNQKLFLSRKDEESSKVLAQSESDKVNLAELKKNLDESRQAKKELTEKLSALESEKNKITLNVRLEKDMIRNELNEVIERLKAEVEKLNEEVGEMKQKIGDLNAEIKTREDDLDNLNGDNDKLREDIERINGINEDLHEEIKTLNEKLEGMKNE